MTGREIGKVSVMDGDGEVSQDRVCNDPGKWKLVSEASVGAMIRGGVGVKGVVTVGEEASPVGKGDGCKVTEEGKVMIEVTNETENSSRVIET